MSWVLPATAGLPALAALVLVLLPRRTADRSAAGIGMLAALASFGCAVAAAVAVGTGGARPDLVTDVPWVPQLGLRFHLGIDGISLPLVLLTAGIGLCSSYGCTPAPSGRTAPRALVICLLLLRGRAAGHLREPGPVAVLRVLRGRAGPDVVPHRRLGRRRPAPRGEPRSSS